MGSGGTALSSWTPTSPASGYLPQLTNGTCFASTVEFDGYIYVIGGCTKPDMSGCTSGDSIKSYSYAKITASGGLGSWTNVNLPSSVTSSGIAGASVAAYNNYIYLMGGDNGGSLSNSVYYASINSDGSLTWNSPGSNYNLSNYTYLDSAAVYNGFLYIFGGCSSSSLANCVYNGSKLNDSIQYIAVNCYFNNTNNCSNTSTANTVPLYYNSMAIKTVGGVVSSNTYSWKINSTTIPTAAGVYGASATVFDGYVYLLGGYTTANSITSNVYYGALSIDGSVGSWVGTSPIGGSSSPISLAYLGSTFYDGGNCYSKTGNMYRACIYEVGGTSNGTSAVSSNTTGSFQIYPVGTPSGTQSGSTWQAASNGTNIGGTSASTAYDYAGLQTYNNFNYTSSNLNTQPYIYSIGGTNAASGGTPSSAVYYGQIGTDGSISNWTSTSTIPTPGSATGLYGEGTATYAGAYGLSIGAPAATSMLYAIGGVNTASGGISQKVFYDYINPDGSLSAWGTSNNSLPSAVAFNSVVTSGACILSVGGATSLTGPTLSPYIYYATITQGSGKTSSWSATTANLSSTGGPGALDHASTFIYDNNLYVVGGQTGSAY